uniref:DNA starvation/stationary phase protection protein n=1 Tax=Roseihalotalea indica TaxID=2867963 RepID=A0AA49GNJ8_9BACT|nr:DNA starvation/stationary phase protection protein [Tunicatimonas sp. TK19036]
MISTAVEQDNRAKAKELVVDQLNGLLADYQIYYQNLRGFHWNVTGSWFFQLHQQFEELYQEAAEVVDQLAERIRALDATPLHALDDYFQKAQLTAAKNVSQGDKAVHITWKNNQVILYSLKETLATAQEAQDQGTASLLEDMIQATEKRIWMLKAFLQ